MDYKPTLFGLLHQGVFGISQEQHAALKGVPLSELDENMTVDELRFHNKAMVLCNDLHMERNSYGIRAIADDVMDAARQIRAEIVEYERTTGKTVTTAEIPFHYPIEHKEATQ